MAPTLHAACIHLQYPSSTQDNLKYPILLRVLQTLERHLVAARGDCERGARVGAQVGRVAGQRAEGEHRAPRLIGLRTGKPTIGAYCEKAITLQALRDASRLLQMSGRW